MANMDPSPSSSSSQDHKDVHKDTLEIHVKTLDSQTHSFLVENNMCVASLKEKIAIATGVPTVQQRLIFRGRILKDDHALSDYHVEDGHTLHLVARQPVQPQTQPTNVSEPASNQNDNRGSDAGLGPQRTRIGHSVVVGLNMTDQGETTIADISRIVGAVLSSFGTGIANNNMVAGNVTSAAVVPTAPQASPGVETDTANVRGNFQTGNQPQLLNRLTGATLRQMVVPDSLITLNTYMTRMEQTLSLHSEGHAAPSQVVTQENTTVSAFEHPNIDALIAVVDRARGLLSGPVSSILSHFCGHLERERTSLDLAVRGQLQSEALHVGLAMQHLGSLFLELGRTVSTIRMGEPPAEPVVISGPAVYINASGPNPLMVQPNSHQPVPIFGIPSILPLVSHGIPEQVRGDAAGNINIHVHAGNSAAAGTSVDSSRNVGEVAHGQSANPVSPIVNVALQMESSQVQVLPQGTFIATISARSHPDTGGVQGSNAPADLRFQTSMGGSHPAAGNAFHAGSVSLPIVGETIAPESTEPTAASSSIVDEVSSVDVPQITGNSRVNDLNTSFSGVAEQKRQFNGISATIGMAGDDSTGGGMPTSTPCDRKNHSVSKPVVSGLADVSESKTTSSGDESVPLGLGFRGLQSMKRVRRTVSRGNSTERGTSYRAADNEPLIARGQQVLQSLVSRRHMDNRAISSNGQESVQQTRNQSADLGGMFSGMLQQMMPAVSQMLGISRPTPLPSTSVPGSQRNGGGISNTSHTQVLQDVLERIAHRDSGHNIFRSVLEAAGRLHGEHNSNGFLEALGNNEELATEFVEMLRGHLHQRLQSGSGSLS